MKFIKSYKIFESNNLSLHKELVKFKITNYIINEDGSIDCNQDVSFFRKNLNEIPFKFNKVNTGYFNISRNNIKSLKNCPKYIDNLFSCCRNKLTSLEYGPEYVGTDYLCHNNKLITLKGCVDNVYGGFECNHNQLISLEFCPMDIGREFICSYNKLTELDRSPFVRSKLWCQGMFNSKPEFNGHCEELIWK